jgi:hypothetical protein
MAGSDEPNAVIDWTSAEVRNGALRLPLTGRLSGAWTTHLSGLVSRLPPDSGARSVEVGAAHLTVAPIRRGAAQDLHDALERLVAETNSAFAGPDAPAEARTGRWTRRRSVAASLLLIALAAAAVALQWVDWVVPVRGAAVLAFTVVAPGWAILRLWDLAGGWAGAGLAIALSLSLAMIVAGVTVYAGAFSPLGTLSGLAGLTVLAAGVSLVRGREREAPKPIVHPWPPRS